MLNTLRRQISDTLISNQTDPMQLSPPHRTHTRSFSYGNVGLQQNPQNPGENHTAQHTGHGNGSFILDLSSVDNQENTAAPTPPSPTDSMYNMRALWKASQGSVPFILLLLAKLLFQHRLGIIVLVGLFGTFFHANSSLMKQISHRDTRGFTDTIGNLCWIVVFLSANIFFIYYVFDDQHLYKSLYLHVPDVANNMDVWNLFWIIGVTDFIIKYVTIILKAFVTMLPKHILLFKKKGKYYMLLEELSQFYRYVLPVVPWLIYLQTTQNTSIWFSYVLCLIYLICKGNHVYSKLKEVKKTLYKFQTDLSYGNVPHQSALLELDNSCPICQDKFNDPVQLTCAHIFCEDCVSMWFDRERTCPMCRAHIVDSPMWRDGATAANIQLY